MAFLLSILAIGVGLALFPRLIVFIGQFLPDAKPLPADVATSINYAIEKVNSFSYLFPIDTAVSVVKYTILFEGGLFLLKIVLRIVKLIRGTT